MGLKYYRASEKPDKIRKRFELSRYWFRDLKWVSYHAHPTMVPGHPFKGGYRLPIGILEHPDMKRFNIPTSAFFYPPTPCQNPYDDCSIQGPKKFSAAGYKLNFSSVKKNPQCKRALEIVQKCEGSTGVGCDYYAQLSKKLCN